MTSRADRAELLAERAAIMEYDGGLDRATAERRAALDVDGRLTPATGNPRTPAPVSDGFRDAVEAARAALASAPRDVLLRAYREGDAAHRAAALALLTERSRGALPVAQARPHRPFADRYGRRRGLDAAALAAGERRP